MTSPTDSDLQATLGPMLALAKDDPEEAANIFMAMHSAMLVACPEELARAMAACVSTAYRLRAAFAGRVSS